MRCALSLAACLSGAFLGFAMPAFGQVDPQRFYDRRQAEAADQQARARQLAEQQQQAEQKLRQQRAIAETKGPEYAGKGDTSWGLSSKTDEMTDRVTLEAFSIQKAPNGVVANVKVRCFDKKFPTDIEPIIVKVPLFEPQVQKVVKSCS
jgi:hypothetical protein